MKVMKITTVGYDVEINTAWQLPWCEDWLKAENRDRVIWEDGEWRDYPEYDPPAFVWETNPIHGFDGGVGYMRVTEEDGTIHEYIVEVLDYWQWQNIPGWNMYAMKVKELVIGRDKFENVTIEGYCF